MIALWVGLALAGPAEGEAWEVVGRLRRNRTLALEAPSCAWERTTLRWNDDVLVLRHDLLCRDAEAGWTARWAEVEVVVHWVGADAYAVPDAAGSAVQVSALHRVNAGGVRGHASRSWAVTAEIAAEGGRLEPSGERLFLRTDDKRGMVLAPTQVEPDWAAIRARLEGDRSR
ncbi:MAG: hypothetical protein ACI8PZ_000352 [Myxococcota bacterium]|jgi:hypothetical protein